MISRTDATEKLLAYLDEYAFRPVLGLSSEDYDTVADKEALRRVQDVVRRMRRRYREIGGGVRLIRDMFRDDLDRGAAREIQEQLEDLGLPTLEDAAAGFEDLCDALVVGS